jgi:predicted RNA-binding protein YlxR (DUF448 family)
VTHRFSHGDREQVVSRKKQGGGKRRKALDHDEPFRTCVACRTSSPKEQMLRFARAPDGSLGFDVRARLPGRGAWTCAKEACVKKAVDKGGFERAFEETVLAKADELAAQVRVTLESEAMHGLGLLKRSAHLAAGREDVSRAFAAGRVTALVLACDLSERSRREVAERTGGKPAGAGAGEGAGEGEGEGRTVLPLVTVATQERLGSAIGRKPTGVLALLEGPRAGHALSDLERLAAFVPQRLAHVDEGA